MPPIVRLAVVFARVIAGCANRPSGTGGKHLVYRDSSGMPTMQFDYPSDDFCRKVEAIAARNARCQANSADDLLQARATLRYNPPDVLIEAHYPDVARCEKANSTMAQGVELANRCRAK
jgi:hypothetical protein